MEKLKLKDFLAYRYLSAPEFAPDGKICAFVAAQAKEDESGYDRDIWLFDPQSERVRPLTSGGDAGQFWWLDESSLLFPALRCPTDKERAERGEPLTCLQRIRIDGGEAQPFCTIPARVSDLRVLDEDHFLLLCHYEIGEADWTALSAQERAEVLKAREAEKDYEVLEEILHMQEQKVIRAIESGEIEAEDGKRGMEQVVENRDVFYRLYRSARAEQVRRYFSDSAALIFNHVVEVKARGIDADEGDKELISRFYRHAFEGCLNDWLESGMKSPLDQQMERLERLFDGDIERALKRSAQHRCNND